MPTVLRIGGFKVRVHLPPREHGPPHVHVRKDGGRVIIQLAFEGAEQRILRVVRMREVDVLTAFLLVEEDSELPLQCWGKYHV